MNKVRWILLGIGGISGLILVFPLPMIGMLILFLVGNEIYHSIWEIENRFRK